MRGPLFIDTIGSSYEEQQEVFNKIEEKYPNRDVIIYGFD